MVYKKLRLGVTLIKNSSMKYSKIEGYVDWPGPDCANFDIATYISKLYVDDRLLYRCSLVQLGMTRTGLTSHSAFRIEETQIWLF